LRCNITGSAPTYSSVITEFQFPKIISQIEHGTLYHWDYKTPFPYGMQKDFNLSMEATRDFVIPSDNTNSILGAIYHASTPAWGILDSSLFGVLFRNSSKPCVSSGAFGTDHVESSALYAIRLPSSDLLPSTGEPLREAQMFHTPLQATLTSSSTLPPQLSLASVTSPSSTTITALKQGTMDDSKIILRLYNPENQPVKVSLSVSNLLVTPTSKVTLATAVEEDIAESEGEIRKEGELLKLEIMLDSALSTICISK